MRGASNSAQSAQALREEHDFITNVFHELKTPLGAIALLAETVKDAADDPQAVRYFAGRIETESQRLSALVGDMIDLGSAGAIEDLPREAIDIGDICQEAIAASATQAHARNIDIRLYMCGERVQHYETATTHLYALGNRRSLLLIMSNLVSNAVRYSNNGSLVNVAVSANPAAHTVTVRVIDRGVGIPQSALPHIFERFYRVDRARSRDTGGSGLGLSIVKRHVEGCGGTVAVWSNEKEGSTFTVTFAAANAVAENGGETS